MASQYYNVTTNNGDAKIANAIATATKLNITHVVFGDGNGSVPTPDKSRTAMVNEVYRVAPSNYFLHPTIANRLIVEAVIPSNIGGFYIREVGLIADTTVLISDGSVAPIFKEASTDGTREYKLKFAINIVDSSIANITLDSSLVYVTQDTIVDNLTTADATKPLSAAQGKVLQDNKLDASEVGLAGGAASLGVDGYIPDAELKKASTTEKGIVQIATVAEVIEGIDSSKAITPNALKNSFQNSFGSNGYSIRPDGLIEQWGVVDYTSNPGEIKLTVTLPISFPNQIYTVTATRKTNGGVAENDGGIAFVSKTLSQIVFDLQVYSTSTSGGMRGFEWRVIGK